MKLFESLLRDITLLKKNDSMLKAMLLQYNCNRIFSPIYANKSNESVQNFGNVCTAFIILAYSNGCHWLDYRKDRRVVKLEVITSVLEIYGVVVDDLWKVLLYKVIDGEIEDVECAINDFVDWQKDGLFSTYIALSTQISLCRRLASSSFGVTEKSLNDRGKFLENLRKLEKDLDDVIDEIERKFQSLDESLKQENKVPISKRAEINTWEQMLTQTTK